MTIDDTQTIYFLNALPSGIYIVGGKKIIK